MLKLISAPATNERGPRYMEKALAAIHQANHLRQPMSLEFGTQEGRVALLLRSLQKMEEFIVGPITANYPNCSITTVEQNEPCPSGWETWTADLELAPELFPILRHAQFEDMLNRNFAAPINGILRAIKPDEQMQCRIEIVVSPAKSRRCHQAAHAVQRLDREFFRHHHRLARYYARHITRSHGWLSAWILGVIASASGDADTNDPRNLNQPSA